MKLKVEVRKQKAELKLSLYTFQYSEGPFNGNYGTFRKFETSRRSDKNAISDFHNHLSSTWHRRVIDFTDLVPATKKNSIAVKQATLSDDKEGVAQ